MSSSTDPSTPTTTVVTTSSNGRTFYDILSGNKPFIAFLFLAIVVVVLFYLFPDSFVSAASSVTNAIKEYCFPAFLGVLLARYIYRKYMLQGVIVEVVPLDAPASCFRMDRDTFSKYTKNKMIINPECTDLGDVLYRVKNIDFVSNIIDGGDIHNKDLAPSLILAHSSKFYEFLEDYQNSKLRVAELTDVPFVEGTDIGIRFVKKNIDNLTKVILGDNHSSEEVVSDDN